MTVLSLTWQPKSIESPYLFEETFKCSWVNQSYITEKNKNIFFRYQDSNAGRL